MPAWSPTNVRVAVRLCGRSREHVVFSAPTVRLHVRQFRPGPPARSSEARGAKKNSWRLTRARRIECNFFAALHMSAFGTKRTFVCAAVMSAFGGKANMARRTPMSAFDPKRTSNQFGEPSQSHKMVVQTCSDLAVTRDIERNRCDVEILKFRT